MKKFVAGMMMSVMVLFMMGNLVLAAEKPTITVLTEDLVYAVPGGIRSVAKLFTRKTGIKVNFVLTEASGVREKALLDMMAGGEASYDVVEVMRSFLTELVKGQYLMPLDQRFPEVYKAAREKTIPQLEICWDDHTVNGHVYAFPRDLNTPIWWYRKDQFKEVGIASPPSTYEEVYEYAKKLTRDLNGDGETDIYGAVYDWNDDNLWGNWCHMVVAFGGQVYNEDLTKATFNGPAGLKALSWMEKFVDEGLVTPDSPSILSTGVKARTFNSGIAAMMNCYAFEYGWVQDPEKSEIVDKWTMSLMPGSKVDKSVSWMVNSGYGIPKNAKHPEAALEFLKFMATAPEVQELYGASHAGLPLTKEVYAKYKDDPLISILAEQAKYTLARIFYTGHDVEIYQIFNRFWSYAVNDQMNNQEALDKAVEQANQILTGEK